MNILALNAMLFHPFESHWVCKTSWTEILTALGTVGAVLTALGVSIYQEWIKPIRKRAVMDLSITPEWPDCLKILDKRLGYVFWVRIRVSHQKGNTAENVEIIVTDFKKMGSDNNWQRVQNFLPLNLRWSFYRSLAYKGDPLEAPPNIRIPAKIYRHCDLGFLRREVSYQPNSSAQFQLVTAVQPTDLGDGRQVGLLDPGKYKFEIKITGDNVFPVTKSWLLEFDGKWEDDEAEMLKRHIKIIEA